MSGPKLIAFSFDASDARRVPWLFILGRFYIVGAKRREYEVEFAIYVANDA